MRVCAHLNKYSRVCEGVVEHGQHVGCRDDSRVVTPGGDQQPVVDLDSEKNKKNNASAKRFFHCS